MKKLVSLILSVLFVMVITVVVHAAETTFEGEYQVKAWAEWNFDKKPGYTLGEDPEYDGWFEQRFRLTITHERSEYLRAVVMLDLVDDTWGMQRGMRINNSAEGDYIDLAYIEFSLPRIGKFTIGKQPVTLGYGLIFSAEAPGVDGIKWENTWGMLTVSAMYFKLNDNVANTALTDGAVSDPATGGPGSIYYNRDANLWAIDLMIIPNDYQFFELFGGLLTADTTWTGSSNLWQDIAPTYASIVPVLGAGVDYYFRDSTWTLGFVGLAYAGNFADMIDVQAEYSWVFGNMEWNRAHAPAAVVDRTMSVQGWNAYLDVSYYNDLLRIGMAFLMGSGEKHYWGPASLHNINMPWLSEDDFAWANIIGNGYGGTRSVWLAPGFGDNAENLTTVKLYFDITPLCCDGKLSINAAVIWAKWTDPVGSGPRVAADGPAYEHPVNYYSNYNFDSWDASTDLGWEFDLGFSYEIMEGLTYTFSGGVLLTGDSWDYVDVDGTREEWGPIWSFYNVLQYSF